MVWRLLKSAARSDSFLGETTFLNKTQNGPRLLYWGDMNCLLTLAVSVNAREQLHYALKCSVV